MNTKYLGIPAAAGLNLALTLSALAQSQPSLPQVQPPRLPQAIPSLLPPQPDPLMFPVAPQITPEPPLGQEQIKILRYEVFGSTVFSPAELAQITQPFTGEVTFQQIQAARNALNQLYLKNNYLTSGAYIPTGQTLAIDGAVVKIQILEGKLEDIKITGTKRLHNNYVRSRLALATQQPLNNDRLIEGLRLLQQDPLIENITAELSGGTEPGTNLLEIKVQERNSFNSEFAINNNRSPGTGSFQRRAQINQSNLTGIGDGLTLAYGNTDGSNSIDASYAVPVNPYQTALNVNVGGINSQIIENPFRSLNITNNSRYYEVGLRHPLVRHAQADSTQEFALNLTASKIESSSTLGDIPFPLARGADENGRTSVTALRFSQEFVQRDSRSVLLLRSQLNFGVDALGATVNGSPDGRFFSWQGQGRWQKRLAANTDLIVQGRVQLADRSLLSLEQFAIGGQGTVRGYRQDALLGDNGAFAAVELQLPILQSKSSVLQITPFVDGGVVWNNTDAVGKNSLLAAGVGLQWRSDSLTARVDWGVPLVNVADRRNSLQENGLYFSVRYSP